MTRRVAETATVSALALVITVAISVSVLQAPSDRIFGMDIVGRHHDPFTVMARFGQSVALGVYSQPFTDVPGTLLARIVGPVAAYNGLTLLTFPLSAAAAYLLARHLGLSAVSGAMAALAFAFSPFHLAHAAYHLHIAQTQWVPLYLLALWRCLDRATPAAVGLLAVSVAGVSLANFYGGLAAAVITPPAICVYWAFVARSLPGSLRHLAITVSSLAVIAVAGAAYAWYAARALVVDRAAFAFAREDLFRYSARWWSYLVPPIEHPLLGGIAERVWKTAGVDVGVLEQQVSLGYGVVSLGCVAIFSWIRDRRRMSGSRVPVLAAVAFVALVCSLSPERDIGPFTVTRPSAVLYEIVPMFRAYARFGVVVQLMAALLAGIAAERLWRSRTLRARVACVALVTCAAGEYAVWPPSLWRDVLPTTAHRWIVSQPNRSRVLDCVPSTPESASVEWLSGYRISPLGGSFDDCAEPNIAHRLAADDYTHVVVRLETPEQRWLARRLDSEGLDVATRFSDAVVFMVAAQMPWVRTDRMTAFHAREYDGDLTWRWMGTDASWSVINSSDEPVVATAEIEIAAFLHDRRMTLLLDGQDVQTLSIAPQRASYRSVPLTLTPGAHQLVFRPAEPPDIADPLNPKGDHRRLSFAFGGWRWTVEGEQR